MLSATQAQLGYKLRHIQLRLKVLVQSNRYNNKSRRGRLSRKDLRKRTENAELYTSETGLGPVRIYHCLTK